MTKQEIERAAREWFDSTGPHVASCCRTEWAFIAGAELVLKRAEKLVEAAELGLSFARKGPVSEGLAPMFYHTLEYKTEVELQRRIDEARALVKEWRGE